MDRINLKSPRRATRLIWSFLAVAAAFAIAGCGETANTGTESEAASWTSILPPLVAIVLAILSRQVIFALFVGVFVGSALAAGGAWSGFESLVGQRIPGALDKDHVTIVVFSCLLGSVVALVARMGGTQAVVDRVSRAGTGPRGAQLGTWFCGLAIFFDDYANALLVGNTMRPVTDRYRVSREKLAYLVDSTSAPVACIFVISTWIATEIGYIDGKLQLPEVQQATGIAANAAYQTFIATIPYNFYPIFTLVFGFTVSLMGRDFGPMLRAERRARNEGKVLADGAVPLSSKEMDELEPVDPERARLINAILPIGTVVGAVIAMLWVTGARAVGAGAPLRDVFGAADSYVALMVASVSGVIVAIALAVGQRLMSLGAAMEAATAGIKAMIPAALVLVFAWALQGVCEDLGTSAWLIEQVSFELEYLPAVIFVLSAMVGFSTGSSWGTMAIIIPLAIDYVVAQATSAGLAPDPTRTAMVASIGSVLAGSVFGDHCSPISDTTIMSSMASGADHIDHVRTQMPYALTVALIALVVGYLPAGFGVSPWICLPIGSITCIAAVRFLGRPVSA